jgi:3-hydroxy-9,10-secoandrosta-1,3,5(10)-triene-9,17-dione monooxygenase reductase component
VTIHASDPFATPDEERSPVRRLRGRLPAAVTLWTAYGPDARPVGLTVSSTVIADGDPGALLGVLDEESELFPAVRASGRFTVTVLRAADRRVADIFAGVVPVPGGPFGGAGWIADPAGPRPSGAPTWVACRVDDIRPLGWGRLVVAAIDEVHLGDPAPPLVHYRGRYADGAIGAVG